MQELKKLQSAQLCANSVGQVVMDCITNPPKPGDESYDLFMKVCTMNVLDYFRFANAFEIYTNITNYNLQLSPYDKFLFSGKCLIPEFESPLYYWYLRYSCFAVILFLVNCLKHFCIIFL